MGEPVRREDAVQILRKLDECLIHLKKGQLHGCLHLFRDTLERIGRTPMIPTDQKLVLKTVDSLQRELGSSKAFREEFGPVSFRDGDIKTSLDFLRQLIRLQEDEMSSTLTTRQDSDAAEDEAAPEPAAAEQRAREALAAAADGKGIESAMGTLEGDEEALALILQISNTAGIEYRKAGLFDHAIQEFRKALFFHPRDEGLHYNIARVYLEMRDWARAEEAIGKGLEVNPEFAEGKALLKYIRSLASAPAS